MKCESCYINKVEVREYVVDEQKPYRLCKACQQRLLDYALRPSEFYNLVAIHGHGHYLHDDFYDFGSGAARQPKTEVVNAEGFPFPELGKIKTNLKKLVDYACVQYFTSEDVFEYLRSHNEEAVLDYLDHKTKYDRAINYKTYEIAANVLGPIANEWITEEWENKKKNEVLIFAEAIYKCLPFTKAFPMLTTEIEKGNEKQFIENSAALLYFQSSQTLDWIEKVSNRITNISTNWGTLAAASAFSWDRAEKWLSFGRPLSLIALDALAFCTTKGARTDQALWFIRNPPTLMNQPTSDIIEKNIHTYLAKDKVPRIKKVVGKIMQNISSPITYT